MASMKWHIETWKVKDVKVFDDNPRKITQKGLSDLKKSIDKFGVAEPIVINLDGTVIGGHARLQVLLKEKEIEVYVPERMMSEDEVKELNVRLNKNVAGEWDWDILANKFDVSDLLEWGFEEKDFDIDLPTASQTEPESKDEMVVVLNVPCDKWEEFKPALTELCELYDLSPDIS